MSAQRELNDYLDGRMSPARRAAFEARLNTDALLADELAKLRGTLRLMRSLPELSPPANLSARIMREVRQKPLPVQRFGLADLFGRSWAPARLVFATAAVALVVHFGLRSVDRPTTEPVATSASSLAVATNLSAADQALVRECMVDYHRVAYSQLSRTTVDQSAQLYDAGLGF